MKFNVIKALIIPWFLFFLTAIGCIVVLGIKFHLDPMDHRIYGGLIVGALCCLVVNIGTLDKAGIWIAYTLPITLRYNWRQWIFNAFKVTVVAGLFYAVGLLPWIPLFWQAMVLPVVFATAVFIGAWCLLGPILLWSSKVAFSRTIAFFMSLPVFAVVAATALFLGQTVLTAYRAARPDFVASLAEAPPRAKDKLELPRQVASTEKEPTNVVLPKRAQFFHDLAETNKPCPEASREIQANLDPGGNEDVVYWAVKAVSCAEMRAVVGLPKLVRVMQDHPSPRVRAAAIRAMTRFGTENVKQVSYLLVKRLKEREPAEVIEAAAVVLSRLNEDDRKGLMSRMKALLDAPHSSEAAAKVLVQNLKRDDLVAEYVAEHLGTTPDARQRAVNMICLLPPASRSVAEPHIGQIVATVKTGAENDPAMEALGCLGKPGFQAIRQEMAQPQRLQKPVAARALAEMDLKDAPEDALATTQNCSRDENDEVRKWCSQGLGKLGVAALPTIIDLLKSNDSNLKAAGTNALNNFDDPAARPELERIRAENSGWMANKKKLQLAKAVDTALGKIESTETDGLLVPTADPQPHKILTK